MLQQEGSDDECEALDVLSKHLRCTSHILNLVTDYDSKATRKDNEYKSMSDRSSVASHKAAGAPGLGWAGAQMARTPLPSLVGWGGVSPP